MLPEAPPIEVLVSPTPFDPGVELNRFCSGRRDSGGIASFIGLVRDLNLGATIEGLHLEHYPGMTERTLQGICAEASRRWSLRRVRVIHRCGDLLPGDPIVAVFCAAEHRSAAFSACEFIMDFLKTEAPFWKRESTPQGGHWVDARASDEQAAGRWQGTAADAVEPDGESNGG